MRAERTFSFDSQLDSELSDLLDAHLPYLPTRQLSARALTLEVTKRCMYQL